MLGLLGYGSMNVALDKIHKQRGVRETGPDGSTSFVVDDYQLPDPPMRDERTEAAFSGAVQE
jgi:hypothetical protein